MEFSTTTIAWAVFGLSSFIAIGWTIFNGMHRRRASYREKVIDSISKCSSHTQKKLSRLLAPSTPYDRWNHATVIAGCCCIILFPVALVLAFWGPLAWWQPFLLVLAGTLTGAYLGELLFNSWHTAIDLPTPTNHPKSTHEDERSHSNPSS